MFPTLQFCNSFVTDISLPLTSVANECERLIEED